nr:hypothetical protein [Paracoccus aminovorans]
MSRLGLRLLTEHALAAGASPQPRHLGDAERDLLIRQALAHAKALDPIKADPERFGYAGCDPGLIAHALARLGGIYGKPLHDPAAARLALEKAVTAMLARFPEGGMTTVSAKGPRDALEKNLAPFRRLQRDPGLLGRDWSLWQSLRSLTASNSRTKTPAGYDELAETIMAAANVLPQQLRQKHGVVHVHESGKGEPDGFGFGLLPVQGFRQFRFKGSNGLPEPIPARCHPGQPASGLIAMSCEVRRVGLVGGLVGRGQKVRGDPLAAQLAQMPHQAGLEFNAALGGVEEADFYEGDGRHGMTPGMRGPSAEGDPAGKDGLGEWRSGAGEDQAAQQKLGLTALDVRLSGRRRECGQGRAVIAPGRLAPEIRSARSRLGQDWFHVATSRRPSRHGSAVRKSGAFRRKRGGQETPEIR